MIPCRLVSAKPTSIAIQDLSRLCTVVVFMAVVNAADKDPVKNFFERIDIASKLWLLELGPRAIREAYIFEHQQLLQFG
jgi:hypothetical protein